MTEARTLRSDAATRSALAAVVVMSLIAVAFSSYLWVVSARLHASGAVGSLPLCPETETISCGDVLASRYAHWFGISLSAVGTLNYVLLLAVSVALLRPVSPSVRRVLWTAGLLLAGLGTLAGVWLVIVQAFILHRYCLLCDLTHACGLVSLLVLLAYRPAEVPSAWRNGAGAVALAATLVLVLGQVLFRPQIAPTQVVIAPATQPQTASSTQPSDGMPPSTGAPAPAFAVIPPVRPANAFDLADAAGTVFATLDMDQEIILGDPKVERTVVEFMDFACPECKQEFGHLEQVLQKHPGWFRLVILLYPRHKDCNAYTNREIEHACEIARAAAAVRKYIPEHYAQAHATFFKLQALPLTGGMAWNLAKELGQVDEATLQTWQDDPTLSEKVKRDTDIVHAILVSQQTKKTVGLPGLFANGKMFNGAAGSVAQLEDHLTQLIGPPPTATVSQSDPAPRG